MEGSAQSLWERCLPIIRNNVDEKQYRTWFEPIQIISFEKQVLTFGLPSQYFYEFLSEHFGRLIFSVVRRVFGEGTQLKYSLMVDQTHHLTVDIEPVNTQPLTPRAKIQATGSNRAPSPLQAPMPQDLDPQLNRNYSFENFIEGVSKACVVRFRPPFSGAIHGFRTEKYRKRLHQLLPNHRRTDYRRCAGIC